VNLVLADVVMPGMSGFTLAGHAARLDSGLKTLFISGYSFVTLARDYGMPRNLSPFFIQKPFGVEALTARLTEVLSS
jgi:two-component system cell cycle response regulator CpdR